MAAPMPVTTITITTTTTAMTMRMVMNTGTPMTSNHDWHGGQITGDTVLDSAYRNTQNVRRFFLSEVGERFKFDRPFMEWMKSHQGARMSDAVAEWLRREAAK
jgi:hypothetical protein